ncbi:MAG: ATP-binding protein [bacterium]
MTKKFNANSNFTFKKFILKLYLLIFSTIAFINFYSLNSLINMLSNHYHLDDDIVPIISQYFSQNFLIICFSLFIIFYLTIIYLNQNITKPIVEISKELLNIKDRSIKTNFNLYRLEEFNTLCRQITYVEDDVENIVNNLNLEKNKIDYLLDNMTEGFLIFDKDKKVYIINKKARQILDCYKKELKKDIIYYTKDIKILENIDIVLQTKQNIIFDMKRSNGKIYSVRISPVKAGIFNQKKSGGIILLIDNTIHKKVEKLKDEFLSDISHELKTPLTSIQGYTELLLNDFAQSKEQEKEFLTVVQKEITNMTCLINDILTISKLESKEIDINKTNVNLKEVVADVINTNMPMIIDKKLIINNDCELVLFDCDYKKMHQLFSNLITNAIKYNNIGGSIFIDCLQDDHFIYINVKDTGIGIPLVDKKRIFERFYRVDKGRSKSQGGTGLGLSIVRHIVKYYNGSIVLESEENKGSEFKIKIPIK